MNYEQRKEIFDEVFLKPWKDENLLREFYTIKVSDVQRVRLEILRDEFEVNSLYVFKNFTCEEAGEYIAELNQRLKIENRSHYRRGYYRRIRSIVEKFEDNLDELRKSVERSQKAREDVLYFPPHTIANPNFWFTPEDYMMYVQGLLKKCSEISNDDK